jgi:hypothetical protein
LSSFRKNIAGGVEKRWHGTGAWYMSKTVFTHWFISHCNSATKQNRLKINLPWKSWT